jgi:hypothetical protein
VNFNLSDGHHFPHDLASAVRMWPTPTAEDAKCKGNHPGAMDSLHATVKLFPTPSAADSKRAGNFGRGEGNPTLAEAAKLFPKPASRDYRSPNAKPYSERGGRTKGEQLPNAIGGQLNPMWVEWLMGYPLGWTDCADSATRSSRKSRNTSAGKS